MLGWVALLVFAGCVTAPTPVENQLTPEARTALYELDRWQLRGRIAVRTGTDKWQASLRWLHVPGQDELHISGPLGQGAVQVTVREGFIRVVRADGSQQESDDPQRVMNSQLGFPVPLADLHYWVLGIPGSSALFVPEYDPLGRLKSLRQSEWLISYQRYEDVAEYVLPTRIKVGRASVQLKIVVDDWQLRDEESESN